MARRTKKEVAVTTERGGARRTKKAEVNVLESDVEVEEVKSGLSLEDGISITTALELVGALALVILALQRYPGYPA